MPIFTLRTGAPAHPEGSVLQDITDTIDTSGVNSVIGTDFKVVAQATPDLTAKVQLGRAYIEASSGNTYPIRADSDSNVSVASNSSGNPRIDALVLFIDLSAAPNTDASNVAKLQVVQGTPAPSPVAPTDGAIQTDIGASNPFVRLANITVASGATSITNPNIADTRAEVIYVVGGVKTTKGYLNIKEQSAAPGTPAAGSVAIYAKTDKKVYKKDSTGAETEVGSGGGGATDIITGEVPAGVVDGVNTNFTTAVNFATGSLRVHKNGVRLKGSGVDFTESIGGFTLVTPPASGTILLVDYFKVSTIAAGGSTSFIYNEVPTGVINGVNVNFATAFPYVGGTLQVYRDGQLMKPGAGNDYIETTPASGLFDFVLAPSTNSNLQVSYQKSLSVTGNADTVDGFHASSVPIANQLIALNGLSVMPTDTVDTASIKNNAITTPKIGDAQVTQQKLAPGVGGNADHSFRLTTTTNTNTTSTVESDIFYDGPEQFDTDNLHATTSNPNNVTITAPTAGKWLIIANAHFAGNSNGQRIIRIRKNGGQISSNVYQPPGANNLGMTISTIIDLAAGDIINVVVYQDSGGSLSAGNSTQGGAHFDGIRIAS